MTSHHIRRAEPADFPVVLSLVEALLAELGEEGEESGELPRDRLAELWRGLGERHLALLAVAPPGAVIGILTLVENFAFYAHGLYGVINEMYVVPDYRSSAIGASLIAAAAEHGRSRAWSRIDVTAPEADRWVRSRRFYEKQGFVFAGPKLKLLLARPPGPPPGGG